MWDPYNWHLYIAIYICRYFHCAKNPITLGIIGARMQSLNNP